MVRIMLRLLGYPQAGESGGFPLRGYEVMAYVALARGQSATREEVAILLWGNENRRRSLANLRFVLAGIRAWQKSTGQRVLSISNSNLRSVGATDLDRLVSLAGHANVEAPEILSLVQGELLAGDSAKEVRWESWLTNARAHVGELQISLALKAQGSVEDLLGAVDAAMHNAPYDERLLKRQVQLLIAGGRTNLARAAATNFGSRLQKELDADISAEMQGWLVSALPDAAPAEVKPASALIPLIPPALPKVVVIGLADRTPGPSAMLTRAMLSEVNIALCSMRTFAMFAPHTARRLHGDYEAHAKTLGADYAVITEFLTTSRMAYSLLDLRTRRLLVADAVDLTTLAKAADDIALAVAATLSQGIETQELASYRKTGEASPYVHYVLGCERLKYDLPSIRKSRKNFQRALDLYPRFAPAKAMLAKTLCIEWLVLRRTDPDLLYASLSIAQEAINLDPHIPAGHWSMGTALLYLNRIEESLDEIQAARGRAPHMADLLADEGDLYVHAGHLDLALSRIDEAMRLNPLLPDDYQWLKGSAQFLSQDYAGALATLGQMDDQRQVGRMMAGSAAMIGEMDRARHYRDAWMEMYPDFRVADWAKQIPLRNRTHIEAGMEAMRRAGFL